MPRKLGSKDKGMRKDNYSYLPPHMRYAMQNPVVGIHVEDMTDEHRAEEAAYNKRHGRLDTTSRNYYLLVKGNPERLERAYKETAMFYKEHVKRKDDQVAKGDEKMIADIYKIITDASLCPKVLRLEREGRL